MVWFSPVESRKNLWGHLAWFLGWCFVTACGLLLHPSTHGHGTHQQLGLPPCPSVALFGRPCPGCGLTTSFTALLHGQVGYAFHVHPFGPILYLAWTLTALLCLRGFVTREAFRHDLPPIQKPVGAFTIAFLVFGAARFALTRADFEPEPPLNLTAHR